MNGSGTQADPYRVTTCDEFMSFFDGRTSLSNKYVKIMNNLNFRDDPTWRGGFTNANGLVFPGGLTTDTIMWSDNGVNITGLQVTGSHFIYNTNAGLAQPNISNINFISCVLNQTTEDAVIVGNKFTDCKISIFVKSKTEYSTTARLSSVTTTRCSICMKYRYPSNYYYRGYDYIYVIQGGSFYNSYIYMDSVLLPEGPKSVYLGSGLNNSTLIFNNAYISGTGYRIDNNLNSIVYLNGIYTGSGGTGITVYSSGANSVIGAGDTGSVTTTFSGSNTINCTPTQIRDKNYLISIGFIP